MMELSRISLREMLLFVLLVFVSLSWWADRVRLEKSTKEVEIKLAYAKSLEANEMKRSDNLRELGSSGLDESLVRIVLSYLTDPSSHIAKKADALLRNHARKFDNDELIPDKDLAAISKLDDNKIRLILLKEWIRWMLESQYSVPPTAEDGTR